MVGKESLESASTKVFAYHIPRGQSQRHLPEQTLNRLVNDPACAHIARKVGVPVVTPSVIGVRQDIGGDFTQQTYEIEEGEIACALIQIRASAPLNKLEAKLLTSPKTRYKTADFAGRFDLLTLEDALNKGATISPQFRHLFKESTRDAAFNLRMLEPELAPAPAVQSVAVQTATGTKVIVTRDRRRALEM
jgi:hypothetical protein